MFESGTNHKRLSPTNDVMIVTCSCMYLIWPHDVNVVMMSPTLVPIYRYLVVDKPQR